MNSNVTLLGCVGLFSAGLVGACANGEPAGYAACTLMVILTIVGLISLTRRN